MSTSAAAIWTQTTRRFALRLALLMAFGFILSNAAVNSFRSDLPFGATLLTNLFASFTWLLPWVAIVVVIGFLAAWGALQIGTHRSETIRWWRGGLAAFAAAILIVLAHYGLNSGIDQLVSVQYTGDGRATEAITRMLVGVMFVLWSTAAGVVLSLSQRNGRRFWSKAPRPSKG